jgi:cellobiose-specific phosphotransferase system component IIC
MAETILYLVVVALMGYWCYTIAKKNDRSTTLAIFMGIIFGLIAVIVYYCIGKSQSMRAKELNDAVDKAVSNKK